MAENHSPICSSPKDLVNQEVKSIIDEASNQQTDSKKGAGQQGSFFQMPVENDGNFSTLDSSVSQQTQPQLILRKELNDQTNLNGPLPSINICDSAGGKGSLQLKVGANNNSQSKPSSCQNENVLPAPGKKKREFNLPLMVEEISKVEKEIPLADGGSQKKKKNVFTFYDNFHEYTVFCDVAMKKGSRDIQEDRFSAVSPLDAKHKKDSFFAVYDGHGTTVVADTLKEHLHKYISKNEHYPSDIHLSIKESFQKIDEEILLKQKEQILSSGGSTALCCLIRGDQLYIINCGDSSSVMVSNEYSVEMLNNLHKPSQKEEAERLKKQNTLFTHQRVMDTLAVTRALGDYKHKEYIISEPEILVYTINEQSKYCLLGTDGFWDIVNYQLDLPQLLQTRDTQKEECERKSLKDLSTFLVEHASNKRTQHKKDNMTVLAIDLNWFYRQHLEFKDKNTGGDSDLDLEDESSNCVMCSSKSQLNINTQFSSFMFQAKSPHSVGRNIEKKFSLANISHPQNSTGTALNYAKTCSKPVSKKVFFDFEEQSEENKNENNLLNNVLSSDMQKSQAIDDIPEDSNYQTSDDAEKHSSLQGAQKKQTGGFFQF